MLPSIPTPISSHSHLAEAIRLWPISRPMELGSRSRSNIFFAPGEAPPLATFGSELPSHGIAFRARHSSKRSLVDTAQGAP